MSVRALVALFGGFLFCASALWVLQRLIEQSVQRIAKSSNSTTLEFIKIKPPELPAFVEPEPPIKPPEPPPVEEFVAIETPAPPSPSVDLKLAAPRLDLNAIKLGSLDVGVAPSEKRPGQTLAPRPLSQPRPRYPALAARRGIEGWVRVSFTVTAGGSAANAKIVAAKPPNVFNKAALQALRRWRFKPALVNGKPVARRVTQTIAFDLSK